MSEGLMGFDAIRQASKEMNERRAQNSGPRTKELWMGLRKPGDSVVVRFLEQGNDVQAAYMHEVQRGRRYFYVKCLDQNREGNPCPGCEHEFKRTIKGYINVIWRNCPQLQRGDDGKAVKNSAGQYVVEGHTDDIAVWEQGITTFEELADKDLAYKGLSTRDFKITKRSKGYSIDPALDENGNANATPMSASDIKLAETKCDIASTYLKTLTYEEMEKELLGGVRRDEGGVTQEAVAKSESPFQRNNVSGGTRANRFL